MMKNSFTMLLSIIILFSLADKTFAEVKVITSTGKFVMGDKDSKSDAKSIALINAKRAALEEAGTYLSSLSEVKNFEMTKDERKFWIKKSFRS